jgi:hypothetical protein
MSTSADDLLGPMVNAARIAAGNIWDSVDDFVVPELRQIAARILLLHNSPHNQQTKKKLFQMQYRSALSVLVTLTELTIFQVEKIFNAALKAISSLVSGLIGFKLV